MPTQSNSLWSRHSDKNVIDYDLLSQSLLGSSELHHKKFNAMRKTHTRLNQIKKVFNNDNEMMQRLTFPANKSHQFNNPALLRTLNNSSVGIGEF